MAETLGKGIGVGVATVGNGVAAGLGDGDGLTLTAGGVGPTHPMIRAAAMMRWRCTRPRMQCAPPVRNRFRRAKAYARDRT